MPSQNSLLSGLINVLTAVHHSKMFYLPLPKVEFFHDNFHWTYFIYHKQIAAAVFTVLLVLQKSLPYKGYIRSKQVNNCLSDINFVQNH